MIRNLGRVDSKNAFLDNNFSELTDQIFIMLMG